MKVPKQEAATTWFVSRHPGAISWSQQQGLAIDRWVEHLDVAQVRAGDTVIGSLPVHLAADVCARGARYLHLVLAVPKDWRGRELSSEQMVNISAQLTAFYVAQLH